METPEEQTQVDAATHGTGSYHCNALTVENSTTPFSGKQHRIVFFLWRKPIILELWLQTNKHNKIKDGAYDNTDNVSESARSPAVQKACFQWAGGWEEFGHARFTKIRDGTRMELWIVGGISRPEDKNDWMSGRKNE